MFKLADIGIVEWPVHIDHGSIDSTLHLQYQVLGRKELRERARTGTQAMLERLNGAGAPRTSEDLIALLDAANTRDDGDEALLLERVKGWRAEDMADADGAPVPYSAERLQALLAQDFLFGPIRDGLFAASRAGPAKNSKPGPAGTPGQVQA